MSLTDTNTVFLSANTERDTLGVVMHTKHGVIATIDSASGEVEAEDGRIFEVVAVEHLIIPSDVFSEGALVPNALITKGGDGKFRIMAHTGPITQAIEVSLFVSPEMDTFSDAMQFMYRVIGDALEASGIADKGQVRFEEGK